MVDIKAVKSTKPHDRFYVEVVEDATGKVHHSSGPFLGWDAAVALEADYRRRINFKQYHTRIREAKLVEGKQ
jgi:hypothetical protein